MLAEEEEDGGTSADAGAGLPPGASIDANGRVRWAEGTNPFFETVGEALDRQRELEQQARAEAEIAEAEARAGVIEALMSGSDDPDILEIERSRLGEADAARVVDALWGVAHSPESDPGKRRVMDWFDALTVRSADGLMDLDATIGYAEGQLVMRGSIPCTDDEAVAQIVRRYRDLLLMEEIAPGKAQPYRWDGRVWTQSRAGTLVALVLEEFKGQLRVAINTANRALYDQYETQVTELVRSGMDVANARRQVKEQFLAPRARRLKELSDYLRRICNNSGSVALQRSLGTAPSLSVSGKDFLPVPGEVVCRDWVLIVDDARQAIWRSPHDSVRRVLEWADVSVGAHLMGASREPVSRDGLGGAYGLFRGLIREAVVSDAERWHLQKALGSALLGNPRWKLLLNLMGEGNSGKSVLLEVLRSVLGGYCSPVPTDVLMERRGGSGGGAGPNPAFHRLRTCLLVTAHEPDERQRWDATLIKSLTGGDVQTSRGLYVGMIDWVPRFLMVVASNQHVLMSSGASDPALTARINVIRFQRTRRGPDARAGETWEDIPEEERLDPQLKQKILTSEEERAGVLAWLLEGVRGVWDEGLVPPVEVMMTTEELVRESSTVARWIDVMCGNDTEGEDARLRVLTPDEADEIGGHGSVLGVRYPKKHRLRAKDALEAFNAWATSESGGGLRHPLSEKAFMKDMRALFGEPARSKRGLVYLRLARLLGDDGEELPLTEASGYDVWMSGKVDKK